MNKSGVLVVTLLLVGCDVTVDADISPAESSFSASYSQTSGPVDQGCLESVLTKSSEFEVVSSAEGTASLKYGGHDIHVSNTEAELKLTARTSSASDISVEDTTNSVLSKIEEACT